MVPHGGYGRRDVAPYSDVDLMLLHHPRAGHAVSELAKRLVTDISDVGLQLGFSVRTPVIACQMARRDPVIFTSQAEARFLAGSVGLFTSFMKRFRREAHYRARGLIAAMNLARRDERRQFGETVFLLEPNVKRSRGTLRDIQMVRWIGFARYGEVEPKNLRLAGKMSPLDERRLRNAQEFLLRLRNELHFHASKPYDVLYRAEQVRIAELWGYDGDESMLPVEKFMQDYFKHTSKVREIVSHFRNSAAERDAAVRPVSMLVSRPDRRRLPHGT